MAATKFDVGTYKLAAEISGEGSPAVVFSSGSGDAGDPWDAVIPALRSSTTVVTYARAGIGESETPADSTPRSVGDAADELHRLLVATGVAGPFVLVGHSLGALVALTFAAKRPQDLAGLVLVDATDIHLNLDVDNPRTVVADGDRDDHLSFDVLASTEEVARSRRPLDVPSVVIASRVGRWLDVDDPEPWLPFSLAELDDRWQNHHRTLAADIAATHKIARFGHHYVQKTTQPSSPKQSTPSSTRPAASRRLLLIRELQPVSGSVALGKQLIEGLARRSATKTRGSSRADD